MDRKMAGGWRRRRLLAAAVRVVSSLAPLTVSFTVGIAGHALVPGVSGTVLATGRWLLILVASLAGLVATDKLARRFLPLAALLQLSLSFPDRTPSRFKLALRQGSSRRRARAAAEAKRSGISDEPTLAAEQLLLLAGSIGDHDRRTRGHSERVRLYADLIGDEIGLTPDEREKLQWAALIHDIGKLSVPAEILNKKGKPDEREWSILKGHPEAGEDLVDSAEAWLGEWVHAVGGHHERWDGAGYPRGLRGEEIPRAATIVAVADAFEVMTAARSYKKGMTLADARRELTRCAGSHFSPEIVRAMLNVSIGELRRSMGIMAAIAHVPFLGRVTTAAAYAPDTVSAAVGATTSAAGAGAGAVAVTAALAVSGPVTGMAAASAPPPAPAPVTTVAEAGADVVPLPVRVAPAVVAAASAEEPALVAASAAVEDESVPADVAVTEVEAVEVVAADAPTTAPDPVPEIPVSPPPAVTPPAAAAPAPAAIEFERPVTSKRPERPVVAPVDIVDEAPAAEPGPPAHAADPGPPAHAGGGNPDPGPPADAGPPEHAGGGNHDPGPPADVGPPEHAGGGNPDPGPPAEQGNGNGNGNGNGRP